METKLEHLLDSGMCGFSLIHIFLYMPLDSVHLRESLAQGKTLYLHILYTVQLSLWVSLGTTLFFIALGKYCA